MENKSNFEPIQFIDESVSLREEIEKYVYYWKWFALGIVVALTSAFLYLRYTPNQFEVATTILIDDEESGGLASELSAFEDIGLLGSAKKNLDNEIELLKSRTLIENVIKNLEYNVTYFKKGRVIQSESHKYGLPFKINFFDKDSILYRTDTTIFITKLSETQFKLENESKNKAQNYLFGENIKTVFGDLTLIPTKLISANNEEIVVKITPLKRVVNHYKEQIQVTPINKNSSVLKISLKDKVKSKAQDLLNALVKKYNSNAIANKSLVAKNTDAFINDRLEIISKDLLNVDKGVEQFKTSYKLTDISSEANLYLEASAALEKKIVDLNTQIKLAAYVQEHVKKNKNALIPANLGFADVSISQSTLKFNELLLERNRILKSSSTLNPVIVNLNEQVNQLRESIEQSLHNLSATLQISLNDLLQQEKILNSKITTVPKQEREFRDIQREQQIIESLYLYLLQKREENAISLAVTVPDSKIIDRAYGSDIPVSPKKQIIFLAAGLLGLIIPFSVLYIRFLLDNKIHTRKDVQDVVKAPFLGDIPKTAAKEKVVVTESDRSSVAEAFRVLRTNISFMLSGSEKNAKTIFITSTIAAEGKTFIAINLASVLAVSSKKVLLVGADIRKPKINEYLNVSKEKGLTDFLTNNAMEVSEVVFRDETMNFDTIHTGIIPPNPSELLMNGRFNEIIKYGEENYDFIIVDTAPINLVTDTLLLSHYADLFVYVLRANFLDKRLLEIPKNLYAEKRLPNMAMLLNDADHERGYGYGYGYGYGESTKTKNWMHRLF